VGGNGETLVIRWPSAAQGGDGLADALLAELRASRSRDQRLGFTSVGPHRDPVVVELNGVEARRHASRGQHRTVAVSLRLALLVWSSRLRGDPPLFLLDDPGAELDARRMAYLGGFLEAWPGQVFIACTEGSLLPIPAQSRNLFRVADGRIQPQ
jgi:DNA replication and repair protein RecF